MSTEFVQKSTESQFMWKHREKHSELYYELFSDVGFNWEEGTFVNNVKDAVVGRVMRLAFNERENFFLSWIKKRVQDTIDEKLLHD